MRVSFWALLIYLLLSVSVTLAQTTGANLQGTIIDPNGAVVVNGRVVMHNTGTGTSIEVQSDNTGHYRFQLLPPGDYEIEISALEFQTVIRKGLRLTVGQEAVLDITLMPAGVSAAVAINSAESAVNTTSATLSSLVTQEQIRNLPLNGRSFEQLVLLQTGVIGALSAGNDVVGGRTPKISINGGRPETNNFLLDGTDINNVYNKTPGSVAGVLLGVEAVLEFRVLTNAYSAEYGGRSGGVVNAVTRSGTNNFHGALFYFHRNSALDAKNYFDKKNEPIPPFKRNQFGGVIGGPIKRDKTFFFAAYEGLIERLGVTGIAKVPDASARQGILPTGNVTLHPAIPAYLNLLFPLPNSGASSNGVGNYLFSKSQPLDEFFIQGRVDHHFSDKSSFFGRYTISNGNVDRQPINKVPIAFTRERSRNQYITLEHQYTFSPTTLNIFRLGFSRSTQEADNERTIDIPSSMSFIPGEQFGFISISGVVTELGGDLRLPRFDRFNNYQLSNSVLFAHGRHDLRLGFQLQRIQFNQNTISQRGGVIVFNNLADFLRGLPRNVDFAVPGKIDPVRGYRQWMVGFFVQDDLKLKKNLTLNLGLRYEFISVPTEVNGKISNLHNVSDNQLTIGAPWHRNPSPLNFAPRFGIAWDPLGDGKTSIRAGAGIFYDQILPKYYFFSGSLNPPFTTRTSIQLPPFPNVIANFNPNASFPAQLQTTDFDLQTPYMIQHNLSVQRALSGEWSLTLAYAGSRGNHLMRLADANLAPEAIVNGVKTYNPLLGRRNPAFAGIFQRTTDAQSFYHSFQANLIKQFTHNWRAQIAYTFSRSVDDSSGINSQDFGNVIQYGMDYYDRKADRGLSAFHAKHNLTFNWTYELSFGQKLDGFIGALIKGWQINNITTIRSGHPFTVRLGFNRSRNLNTTSFAAHDRPNIKAGINPITGRPDQYLDLAAFELPPEGQRGNLGRNTFIGPGLVAVDLSIVKIFKVGESRRLHFRTEFFNLPNHPNFAVPSALTAFSGITAQGSPIPGPFFGQITSTVTTSRQIQFGLKVEL